MTTAWRRSCCTLLMLLPLAAAAQTKVLLGHTGIADYVAAFVAKEQGLFAKRGLDVELQTIPSGSAASGLQSGSIQVSTLPPTTLLQAAEGGLDLMALAGTSTIPRSGPNPALVVKKGSTAKAAADLVGKKIGIPSLGGTLHVMARKWARDQGADDRRISFVEANFPAMADLIKGGTLDGAVLADPFLGRALAADVAQVLAPLAAGMPEHTTGIFYGARREWLVANPAAAKAFRDAIAEGAEVATRNPDAARAAIAKHTRLPPPVVAALPLPPLKPEIDDDQVQFWIDTMRSQELLKTNPRAGALVWR